MKTFVAVAVVVMALAAGLAIFSQPNGAESPAAPAPAAAPPRHVTLFFSSDLHGYIAPCGCSSNPLGGIAKSVAYVKSERAGLDGALYFDAGEALFESDTLTDLNEGQEKAKLEVFRQAFAAMGLSAINVGQRDLAAGSAYLKSLAEAGRPLPLLSHTFGTAEDKPFFHHRLFEAGPAKVGVIAVSDAVEDILKREEPREHGESAGEPAPLQAAKAELAALKERGANVIVLLTNLGTKDTTALVKKLPGVTFAVASGSGADSAAAGGSNADQGSVLAMAGKVPVFAPYSQGRALGRADFFFVPGAAGLERVDGPAEFAQRAATVKARIENYRKQLLRAKMAKAPDNALMTMVEGKMSELEAERGKIENQQVKPPPGKSYFHYSFVTIDKSLPDDPEVAKAMDDYNRKLGAINVARYKGRKAPPPAKGKAAYAGTMACVACHAPAYEFWKTTKHAHAYATLEQAHKQFDVTCIGCHVVGWEMPGGLAHLEPEEGLKNVGCENCHGPGSLHMAAPAKTNIARAAPAATCTRCHNEEHSDLFKYDTYLPHILGPGHGQPKTEGNTK